MRVKVLLLIIEDFTRQIDDLISLLCHVYVAYDFLLQCDCREIANFENFPCDFSIDDKF